jgi:phenylalanyl-tRNA synthetase beta chain
VDTGSETFTVVCGAPNTASGLLVPLAKPGAILGRGQNPIQSQTMMGIRSEGMICSEKELGLGDDHEGILILDPEELPLGTDLARLPFLHDSVCLSHFGIAREVGVIIGRPFVKPSISVMETGTPIEERLQVSIADPEACPRYCARVVQNVSIRPSPLWLKMRLRGLGLRPINNVVDITNSVLMETGHPLHPFDYNRVEGRTVHVRKALPKESFRSLDNRDIALDPNDLLICDSTKPIGLAGIMGGLNSEITDKTCDVLLESAVFQPNGIRKTAKRLGISTEASYRFERGVDAENAIFAVDRAALMIAQMGKGKVCRGRVDAHPRPAKPWTIPFHLSRISTVLGAEIPAASVKTILESLGLSLGLKNPVPVTVPTFRQDLRSEIDLIEEVVRHYGYETIPPKSEARIVYSISDADSSDSSDSLRDGMVGLGFFEILTNSLVSEKHVGRFAQNGLEPVRLINPLSPDTAVLRTSMIPSLLDTMILNTNRFSENIRLFEIGSIYGIDKKSQYHERLVLAGGLIGSVLPGPFWGEKNKPIDFYHVKGIVENLLNRFHVFSWEWKADVHPWFSDERCLWILSRETRIGTMGEIDPAVCKEWDIDVPVFALEIDIAGFGSSVPEKTTVQPIPKYPSVKRDLAFVVDESTVVGPIRDKIQSLGGTHLVHVELFDLYRGQSIPNGKKSVAFSLTFQSETRTLNDEEIEPGLKTIVSELEKSFGAVLRS